MQSSLYRNKNIISPFTKKGVNLNQMQCTSYYRDPYEQAAWQLYLREGALRVAREEVAFLQSIGGATEEDIARIRSRLTTMPPVGAPEIIWIKDESPTITAPTDGESSATGGVTVSLKSILTEVVQADAAANQLCRKVRPLLEQNGIVTFKKHQAIHVLRADAQKVKDLATSLQISA